jgi:hypothetical protein
MNPPPPPARAATTRSTAASPATTHNTMIILVREPVLRCRVRAISFSAAFVAKFSPPLVSIESMRSLR